ncbi:MAG: hypothetical protein ACRD8Z_21650 [Nitrososphaeraceae archaeon]
MTIHQRNKRLLLELRRDEVLKLTSRGFSQRDIAKQISISPALVNNDIKYLKQKAVDNIQHYVSVTLPVEMEHSLTRLKDIIKQAFTDMDTSETSIRDRHNAMQIVKDCSALRLEILGSGVLANQLARQESSNNIVVADCILLFARPFKGSNLSLNNGEEAPNISPWSLRNSKYFTNAW